MNERYDRRTLYLPIPHPRLIMTGYSKKIVLNEVIPENETMNLASSEYLYGLINLFDMKIIGNDLFDNYFDEHHIYPEEKNMRWKEDDTLYIYHFSFLPIGDILPIKRLDGKKNIYPAVKLIDDKYATCDLINDSDEKLLLSHVDMHRRYMKSNDKSIEENHSKLVKELKRRGYNHYFVDNLDSK